MPSAKEQIANILQDQPEDSSYDEILLKLTFAGMIERGHADSGVRRTISHEEMGHRIKKATKPRAGWAEAARRMRARDEDRLIDSPGTNPFR